MNPSNEQTAAALRILIMRLTADAEAVRHGRLSPERTRELANLLEGTARELRERVDPSPAGGRGAAPVPPWPLRERSSGPPR